MSNWGILNHNPGNLEASQPWEGMVGTAGPNNRFAVFKDNVWGFRAMFRNYITYLDRGINTIRLIVNRWSPASDNVSKDDPDGTGSVNAYIAALVEATGFQADEVIGKNWNDLSKLVYAQTIHECGQFAPAFTQTQMQQGAFRAGIVDAPPPLAKKVVATVAGYGAASAGVASAAQPIIQGWQAVTTDHTWQIVFGVAAGILGLIAAVTRPKATSQ